MRAMGTALALFWILLPSAGAQIPTGKILGTVRDETGAVLPQASLLLRSAVLFGGSDETVSNQSGDFRFFALPPGEYTLEARLSGFRLHREEGLRLEAGATIERSLTLALGLEEEVTVRAEPPMVDRTESGVSLHLGEELHDQIPRRRSDFMDLIKTAPGISATRPTDRGWNNVSAFGSGTNENLFLIDGLDQTDPWDGTFTPFLSTDSVEEIEISASGASAEFGNFQGAVFNVVTKTGGNAWRFDGSYYHEDESWAATGPTLDCRCPSGETGFTNLDSHDATVQAGGPFLRDRLWFFGNFQYRRFQENWPGSDPDFVSVAWEKRAFEKLSFQVNPRFTLRQTYQDGENRYPDGADATFPAEVGVTWSQRDPILGLGATHVRSENTLVDATFSGRFTEFRGEPNNGSITTPYRLDGGTGMSSGGAYLFGRGWNKKISVHSKLTHYADDFLSAGHEMKFGVQFSYGSNSQVYGYPGGAWYYDYFSEPVLAYMADPSTGSEASRSLGFFAEDVAEIGDRLTLSLGLRFDRNTAESLDVPEVDTLGEETGGTVAGLGEIFSWNVLSPRLGFTFALDEDARAIVRGSWGRFHQGGFAGEFRVLHPGNGPWTLALFDPSTGDYSIILETGDPLRDQGFDSGIRIPYTDEFSLGLDVELFRSTAFSASYVRKSGRDFTGWEDTGGVYGTDTTTLPDGRTLTVYPLLNDPDQRFYLLTNPEGFHLTYDGLVLSFEKRWADRWQAYVSYTLSESQGLQVASFRSPGANQNSSVVFTRLGRDPNDLTDAEGNLPNDRTHMFRVLASFEIPRVGIFLGTSYQRLTGTPWAARTFVPLPQGPRPVNIEPRGARRMPAEDILDLRLSKPFSLGNGRRVEILFDVLNVLNDVSPQSVANTNYYADNFAEGRDFLIPRRLMVGVKAGF